MQARQGCTRVGLASTTASLLPPMTTITCLIAAALALLTLPIIILLWATESKQAKAKRFRKQGQTYKAIGQRLSISPTTARRYAIA